MLFCISITLIAAFCSRQEVYYHRISTPCAVNKPHVQTNAAEFTEPIGAFEFCCQLLTPLYAGRVTEEVLYGRGGASLMTSADLGQASTLAWWLLSRSGLHPATRGDPTNFFMAFNDWQQRDPTTAGKGNGLWPKKSSVGL